VAGARRRERVEGRGPVIARVTDIADLHPILDELLDLSEGWEARRTDDESTWTRAPLEDASE
jgi:hypothetical protein